MIKVFGHKSPDTDATGSAIIAAWYYTNILKQPAQPYILGDLNPETKFVLEHWGFETPELLSTLDECDKVVIVDTNNAEELPETLGNAEILEILDHHRLMGNIKTNYVVKVTIKTLASTGGLLGSMMMNCWSEVPTNIKGMILSCILSDTLEFRSPTTTPTDKKMGENLAKELDLDMSALATAMFTAKSDISAFSAEELIKMDSKVAEFNDKMYRIGVLETATPQTVLDRKTELLEAQKAVCETEKLEEAFLFVIDILNEEATLLIPNEATKTMAEQSFNVQVEGDTVLLPGIVSRKKQIIPQLKV